MAEMLPADDFVHLLELIEHSFDGRDSPGNRASVRMVGLVFARPASPMAKQEIVPQLDDWHLRSGRNMDFFFAGYTDAEYGHPGSTVVANVGGKTWSYSPVSFEHARQYVEARTSWEYGGGCELLLTNAQFVPETRKVQMTFTSTVCCQLDLMKNDQAIVSVERFFESVFRFAESSSGSDPTWGFSDSLGVRIAGSALKQAVLSFLPGKVSAQYLKAEHLAVRDVARSRTST